MTREARLRFVAVLERLGIRRVSDAMAHAFGDDPLPARDASPDAHAWSVDRLRTTFETARYYAWANFLRGLLYIPLLGPLARADSPWVILAWGLIGFHALCVFVELHRHNLLRSLPPSNHPVTPPPKVRVGELKYSRWFEPKRWETLKGYRAIGQERFRQVVREYDRKTRGAEPAMAANLAVMELDSRIAESMHWAAAALNVPFVLALLKADSPWVYLALAILSLDLYLVGLQRYHRVRIRTTAAKRHRRPAPAEPETPAAHASL
ncbi:MAG: hypothetical protein ACO1SV_09205 [Fimbriimonas sp.]